MVFTWVDQKGIGMRRLTLVLLISVVALLPATVNGKGTFTHTYNFGFDTSGAGSSVKAQGSLHLDAECGATAHGTILFRESDEAESTAYEATTEDAIATCADTDGNGIAGLTGFTIEFYCFSCSSLGTGIVTITYRGDADIDEPGEYPITFRIESERSTPRLVEVTLRVTGPVSSDDRSR